MNDFDHENRLTAVQVYYLGEFGMPQGWRDTFVYDGLGKLREQLHFTPDTGFSPLLLGGDSNWAFQDGVLYVYDGWRVIQERNEANTPKASYTRGNDLSGTLEGAGA